MAFAASSVGLASILILPAPVAVGLGIFALRDLRVFGSGLGKPPAEALAPGHLLSRRANPPPGAADGTLHELRSPRGMVITFMLNREKRTWMAIDITRARRLGFSAAYLSSHGWQYVGPAIVR